MMTAAHEDAEMQFRLAVREMIDHYGPMVAAVELAKVLRDTVGGEWTITATEKGFHLDLKK